MTIPLRSFWALLARYLRPQRGRALLLAVLLLAGIGLQVVNPLILRHFIDTALAGGAVRTLTLAALLYMTVALVKQAFSVGATYLGEDVAWSATNGLRADLALHCLRLDMGFHKARTPGELIERLDGDVTTLANFFSQFVVRVVGSLLLVIGVLGVLYHQDLRVGLALTAYALLALGVLARLHRVAAPHWKSARQASADLFGFLEERLAGTEDIAASGARDHTLRQLHGWLRDLFRTTRRATLVGETLYVATEGLHGLGMAMGLGVGAYLYTRDAITIGTVYLIVHYTWVLYGPILQLKNQLVDLQKARAGMERVQELRGTRSAIPDGRGAPLPAGALGVAFQAVSFGYVADEPVLREVSFELPAGETLGLLGRTGSGKTTLIRLLFRLWDPDAGRLRLGGVDLREAALADLRRRVAMVTQEVQLFRASVRDNLTFFDRRRSDREILAALEELGLSGWGRSLPRGLDTELEAGGGGLSAGEAQLLAFARVLLADPGLVILDEASSRLDPATEQVIERAVDRLLLGRTGIIIAHRLSTLQRVDRILILEDGRVREHGRRVQLAADPGSRFSQLLRAGLQEELA